MIFDSLVHPDPTGRWTLSRTERDASAQKLRAGMKRHGVARALAVGLGGMPGYRSEDYADWVHGELPGVSPVAFADFSVWQQLDDVKSAAYTYRQFGYRAVKVHPRISGIGYEDERFQALLAGCAEVGLPVLVCTYNFGHPDPSCNLSPASLFAVMDDVPGSRIVALHGGGPDLLRWYEHVRIRRENDVLLDLSMTLVRYAGSSIDNDLRFVAQTLDQRTCLGSDFPDSDLETFAARTKWLLNGMNLKKARNIAFDNLEEWFPDGD